MSYHHPQAPPHYPPAASHYPPGAPAAGAPPQQQHLGDPGPHPSSPDSPTTSSSRKRARPAEMDALAATEDSAGYKDYYATQPPSAQGYYDTSGGAPPQSATDLGSQVGTDNGGFAIEHGDGEGDDDDEDETPARRNTDSTKAGRRKIKIEFIQDKSRRHITFSKRKAGIMKKAYELSTLTGTQVLLLVVSETGLVYTFTTAKLQPLVTQPEGKNLIQACLNAPTGGGSNGGPSSGPSGPGGPPGSGAAGGSSGRGGGGRNNVGGINIGGGAGGGDPGVTGHGGPAGHQHAAGGPPPLESSEGPLDSGSSPTTPFHGGYGGSQYAGGRSMTASSTTAASNSSPALTHASPSLGGETGKRARRRTEIAQKDVSMGVPVGGPPSLRRATLPATTADAAAALEAEAMPNGHPAAATPEYAGEHPTPPTGAPPMSRSYSSSGPGETGNDSPGPMYHAAPGGGPDGWSAHGHYPAHDVGHHGHHQAPYGHGMPAHPPMPMQTAVVQQGWGDFGSRR